MRLPRMTTRRWMIVVASVALLMAAIVGTQLNRRRADFLDRAEFHALEERGYRRLQRQTRSHDPHIAYHVMMARKYQHAACYPWLPVEPDPTSWQEFRAMVSPR